MNMRYDAATGLDTAQTDVTALRRYPDLTDLYSPPRRRFHPMVTAASAFALAATVFYGAEAFLPSAFKPHVFVGGYDREIARAKAEGELAARINYDGRLKLIETDAARWQETCRANLQNVNNLYQAAYSRANMYAQATADIQRQYTSMRYQIVQQTTGGETSAANLATMLGLAGGFFDPQFGQQSLQYADAMRQRILNKLDEAARGGITVSVEGWNTGLSDPSSLHIVGACDMPASLASPQASKGA